MTDYLDLQTAHQAYERASKEFQDSIIAEGKAYNLLMEAEKKVHEEWFSKAMSDEITMAKFEQIRKLSTQLASMEYKKCTKLKSLAKQKMEDAKEKLNVTKLLAKL